jgi:hypothetical protein
MDLASLRRWRAGVAGSRPSRPARPTWDQRWLAMAALLGLVAVVAASWLAQQPPPPLPSSAPVTAFSAERAGAHLRAITGPRPTPVGSPGGDQVRDHLVAELSRLGLATEVQAGLGAGTFGTTTVAGRVENVVATLPGRDPTGRVVLSAHYDSTAGSPGAADDKAAVAAILETARALTSGQPLRNDVVVLLTDGEEPGLLGAAAFAAEHRGSSRGGVVLNWEATGNAGPSVLFETSPGDAELVRVLAASAPSPVGDSALVAGYEAGDQHTDFNVLRDAGYAGLNFALVDGTAYYHSSQDTIAALDPRSVQHTGETMLALTRALGNRDLPRLSAPDDATFFPLLGRLVTYPQALAWPLAGLAVLAVTGCAVAARQRRLTTLPRLLTGTAASLVPLIAAPAAAAGLWALLVAVRPGYAELSLGDPYRPTLYRWALGAVTATVVLAWLLLLRRRIDALALTIGGLVWLAVLAVAGTALLPEAAHYGVVPAAAAGVGVLAAVLLGPGRPRWQVVAVAVGAVPGVALLVPAGATFLGVLGIAGGFAGALVFALGGLLVLPLLDAALPPSRPRPARARGRLRLRPAVLAPLATGLLAVALTGVGLAVDRFDADHPQPTHLAYVLDAGSGTARWISRDAEPPGWTARYTSAPHEGTPEIPLPYGTAPRWTGKADPVSVPAPRLAVLSRRTERAIAVVDLRVSTPRDGDVLTLHTDRPVDSVALAIAGHQPVTSRPAFTADAESRPWPYELRFYDPPPSGVTVTLRLPGSGAARVWLSHYTVGLDAVPGYRPRPADLTRSPDHSSDLVIVGRDHEVGP